VLLFFSRQLRFFSSQFLCLPLPRNNHIHSKPIPTPGNKQVLLTKSLTTSQTRTQQHFSTASFCLVQHSSFLYFYTIPGLLPSFSSTPFPVLLLLVLPENQKSGQLSTLLTESSAAQNSPSTKQPSDEQTTFFPPTTQFFYNHPKKQRPVTSKLPENV
jgi:hypothetical protein